MTEPDGTVLDSLDGLGVDSRRRWIKVNGDRHSRWRLSRVPSGAQVPNTTRDRMRPGGLAASGQAVTDPHPRAQVRRTVR